MRTITIPRSIDRRPDCLLQSAFVHWRWTTDAGGMSHASGTGTGRGLGTGQGLIGSTHPPETIEKFARGQRAPGHLKVRAPPML
jgi:hypothetical protein